MSVRVKTTWYPISRNHHQSVSSVLEPGKKTTRATNVAIPSTSVSRRREPVGLLGRDSSRHQASMTSTG